jgi:hypothetical protein
LSERLESELRALELEWPATPDLAAAVRARLEAEPAPRRPAPRNWLRRPALAYAAAALLAALGATLAASPSARSAILELLGLRSVKVERREPTATPAAPPRGGLGEGLRLGERVTLADARRRVRFPVPVPADLGQPGAVWHASAPPSGGRVTLAYAPQPGLTRSEQTGVGLLVSLQRATVEPFIEKSLGAGSRLERFRLDGDPAFFISGAPHGVALRGQDGQVTFDDQRLAGNTLLVERSDELLVRIEGDLGRAAATAIARSLRPGG